MVGSVCHSHSSHSSHKAQYNKSNGMSSYLRFNNGGNRLPTFVGLILLLSLIGRPKSLLDILRILQLLQ